MRFFCFPDMLHVGFEILKVHSSSSWLDPTFAFQKEKAVHAARSVPLLCDTKETTVCVAGNRSINDIDAAVKDAAFISCWIGTLLSSLPEDKIIGPGSRHRPHSGSRPLLHRTLHSPRQRELEAPPPDSPQ